MYVVAVHFVGALLLALSVEPRAECASPPLGGDFLCALVGPLCWLLPFGTTEPSWQLTLATGALLLGTVLAAHVWVLRLTVATVLVSTAGWWAWLAIGGNANLAGL